MILSIETATESCSTALVGQGTIVGVRTIVEKNIHSERLVPLIDELITAAGTSRKQLEAVAVSIGPGSFTGLRIGVSTAKGLSMALDIPLLAVPTMDGIAEAYRMEHPSIEGQEFCAMIDAKREEAFFAYYSISHSEIHRLSEFSINTKSEILAEASKRSMVVRQPSISAVAIGTLAFRHKKKYSVVDFTDLEPLYIRDFVATTPKNKA